MKVSRVSFHNAVHLPLTVSAIKPEDGLDVTYYPQEMILHVVTKKGVDVIIPAGNIRSMTVDKFEAPNGSKESNKRTTTSGTKKKTGNRKAVAKKEL